MTNKQKLIRNYNEELLYLENLSRLAADFKNSITLPSLAQVDIIDRTFSRREHVLKNLIKLQGE